MTHRLLIVRTSIAAVAVAAALAAGPAYAVPRYIAALQEAFQLDAGVVNGTVVRFLAGWKFFNLTPDSQQETCQMLRDYYATVLSTPPAVEIVDAATTKVAVTCR